MTWWDFLSLSAVWGTRRRRVGSAAWHGRRELLQQVEFNLQLWSNIHAAFSTHLWNLVHSPFGCYGKFIRSSAENLLKKYLTSASSHRKMTTQLTCLVLSNPNLNLLHLSFQTLLSWLFSWEYIKEKQATNLILIDQAKSPNFHWLQLFSILYNYKFNIFCFFDCWLNTTSNLKKFLLAQGRGVFLYLLTS